MEVTIGPSACGGHPLGWRSCFLLVFVAGAPHWSAPGSRVCASPRRQAS